MQKPFWWWQCSDRYIISLIPHLHTPFAPFLSVPNKLCGFCGRKSSWKKRKGGGGGREEKKNVQSSRAVNVEVALPDTLSLISPEFSVDAKQHWTEPTPSEVRSCVKVEVDVQGTPSLIVLMVSVDGEQHWTWSNPESRLKHHLRNFFPDFFLRFTRVDMVGGNKERGACIFNSFDIKIFMFWLFARQQMEAKAETAPKGERNPNPNPTEWNKSLSPNRRRKVVISCCVLVLCWQYSIPCGPCLSVPVWPLSCAWFECFVGFVGVMFCKIYSFEIVPADYIYSLLFLSLCFCFDYVI